jgi:hypothetical protein
MKDIAFIANLSIDIAHNRSFDSTNCGVYERDCIYCKFVDRHCTQLKICIIVLFKSVRRPIHCGDVEGIHFEVKSPIYVLPL